MDRYFVSFAWALTVLTGIGCELLPTDYHESLLFMGLILGGVFAYATILGNVYAIIHSHGQEERTFRKHVGNILGYIDFRYVDNPELRTRIISTTACGSGPAAITRMACCSSCRARSG